MMRPAFALYTTHGPSLSNVPILRIKSTATLQRQSLTTLTVALPLLLSTWYSPGCNFNTSAKALHGSLKKSNTAFMLASVMGKYRNAPGWSGGGLSSLRLSFTRVCVGVTAPADALPMYKRASIESTFTVSWEKSEGIYISVGEAEATRSELEAVLSHETFDERYNACMSTLGDYDVCVAVAAAGEQLRQAVDDAVKRPGVSHRVVVEGVVLTVVYTGGNDYKLRLKPVDESLNIYWTGEYRRVGVHEGQVWYIDGRRYDVADGPSLVVMYQALQRYLAGLNGSKTMLYRKYVEDGLRAVTGHLDYLSNYIALRQQVFLQGRAGYVDAFGEILSEPDAEVARQKCLDAFGAGLCNDVVKMRELLKTAALRAQEESITTYIIDGGNVLQVDRRQSAVFIQKMDLAEFLKNCKYDANLVLHFGGREHRVETYVDFLKALKDLRQYLADSQRRSDARGAETYSNAVGLINERIRKTEEEMVAAIKSTISSKARELENEMQRAAAIIAEFENSGAKASALQYIEAVGADVAKKAGELRGAVQDVKTPRSHTSLKI